MGREAAEAAVTKRSVVQSLPEMAVRDKDVSDMGRVIAGEGYDIFSWSPGHAGAGVPATQVHIALRPHPDVTVVLRLKSARALDELVGVLLQHRRDVWGT